MEEVYWRKFWETGRITDYLGYKNVIDNHVDFEREETSESDYSDRDGFAGISYR